MRKPQPPDGLIRWAQRTEWADDFAAVLAQHLGELCDEAEIAIDDLPEVIGEAAATSAWVCAFEDFVSRELDENGRNVADDYLKRRGWKESPGTRSYIEALRHSVPSVYAVSEAVRNEGFKLRDLVRGGAPLHIAEPPASRGLADGDHIAARVVSVRGRPQLTFMLLRLEPETSAELLRVLAGLDEEARTEIARLAEEEDVADAGEMLAAIDSSEIVLAGAASVITQYWLADLLGFEPDHLPDLVNAEGDPVTFLAARYPLAEGIEPAAVRAALAGVPALHETAEAPDSWRWLADAAWEAAHAVTAVMAETADEPTDEDAPPPIITRLDDGRLVLGTVELATDGLVLVVNSRHRLERGSAMLEATLSGLVEAPVIEEPEPLGQPGMEAYFTPDPPKSAEAAAIMHQSLTAHYERQLDEPDPFLGNKSPRQLARSAMGREKVVAWLERLEQEHAARPGRQLAAYDLGWLWQALGLADRRPSASEAGVRKAGAREQ